MKEGVYTRYMTDRTRKTNEVLTQKRQQGVLTPDFFCQARRSTREGGSVHQVHDRLNEEAQRSMMEKRQQGDFNAGFFVSGEAVDE